MRRAVVAVLLAAAPLPAVAQPYAEGLEKCVAAAVRPGDRAVIQRWTFAYLATSPAIRDYARISPEQRAGFDRDLSTLLTRLLTIDCRAPAIAAVKHENADVVETAFGAMGETAFEELMGAQATDGPVAALTLLVDRAKIDALIAEAKGSPEITRNGR